jgi:hypothetical protein
MRYQRMERTLFNSRNFFMLQPVLRIRIRSNLGPEYFFVIRLRIQMWIRFMDPEQYPELIDLFDIKMSLLYAIFQVVIST